MAGIDSIPVTMHLNADYIKCFDLDVKLDPGAYMPEKAHSTDAGYDLRSPRSYLIWPLGSVKIHTGVHLGIPKGFYGRVASKSGLNVNKDITSEGVIDSGYTGQIVAKLRNHRLWFKRIKAGDKITQVVFERYYDAVMHQVEELDDTDRGDNGFGSTGR